MGNIKVANDENLGADSVAQVQNPINQKIESFKATPPAWGPWLKLGLCDIDLAKYFMKSSPPDPGYLKI